MSLREVHIAAFAVVMAGWLVFAAVFLFRKRPQAARTTRRERLSALGIAFQMLAYAAVWAIERPRFTPILRLPGLLQLIPPLIAAGLSIVSVAVSIASIRTLGREWSYEARLVEGHRLVTTGPYRWIRHPIYGAMLGKLLATGLVVSHWIGLLAGLVLFSVGTAIRVGSEEKLLRAQFGREYDDYARRVPAILPRPFGPR